MKKVLITGGSGMVGRNLLEDENAKYFQIFAPSSNELDLKNFSLVSTYLNSIKPDFIIHAAGKVGGIQANIDDPIAFFDDNLSIGRNIIMGAFNSGIKKFINLASTCIYPREAKNPLSEYEILKGELEPTNEGYALAKIAALKLCQYISQQNLDMQYKTIIPCNLYGRHDNFTPPNSHLLPAIIHKVHQAKINNRRIVEIWGDGTARREFMYAGDLSSAVWKALIEIDLMPDLFNCGLGYDYTINEYYSEVANVIGWNGDFVHDLNKPIGMSQKLSNVSKQKNWGWVPSTSLKEGITNTYSFYLENRKI